MEPNQPEQILSNRQKVAAIFSAVQKNVGKVNEQRDAQSKARLYSFEGTFGDMLFLGDGVKQVEYLNDRVSIMVGNEAVKGLRITVEGNVDELIGTKFSKTKSIDDRNKISVTTHAWSLKNGKADKADNFEVLYGATENADAVIDQYYTMTMQNLAKHEAEKQANRMSLLDRARNKIEELKNIMSPQDAQQNRVVPEAAKVEANPTNDRMM